MGQQVMTFVEEKWSINLGGKILLTMKEMVDVHSIPVNRLSTLLADHLIVLYLLEFMENSSYANCMNTQVEALDNVTVDEVDLPFGLNIDSRSLACVAWNSWLFIYGHLATF